MLETHKPGHGVLVRRLAFWALAAMILWAGQRLYTWMLGALEFSRQLILQPDKPPLEGWEIPVLNQRFNWAFVICWALTLAACFGLWRLLNRPKVADFLVDTDSELKKVSWPSWRDAWNSTIIVMVFVAFLTVFLTVCDQILSRSFDFLLGGLG